MDALALHRRLQEQVTAVGTPIRLDGQRGFAEHVSARVGQDTSAVLHEAGLSAADIAALAAQGVIAI